MTILVNKYCTVVENHRKSLILQQQVKIWRVFEKLKLSVKQRYQTGKFQLDKNCWKMRHFGWFSNNVNLLFLVEVWAEMLSWSWSTCLTRLRFPLKTDDVYLVFVLYFLVLLLKWKTTWDHWNRGSSKYPEKKATCWNVDLWSFSLL